MITNRLCTLCVRSRHQSTSKQLKKCFSSVSNHTMKEVREWRSDLFGEEKKRQEAFIRRIEKIEVEYSGVPQKVSLLMNKDISTPYNCAMHIAEFLTKRSIVAIVNGEPYDMHRPLTEDCELQFTHMLDDVPLLANEVFWRSSAFILGSILETSFTDNVLVTLHSSPPVEIETGCFIYDADLGLPNWRPKQRDLQALSIEARKIKSKRLEFERLEVNPELAMDIFKHNKYKIEQIPEIAECHEQHKVTMYRLGDHVDLADGPLMASTANIDRFTITGIFPYQTSAGDNIRRVQGLALPSQLEMHWWNWEQIEKRAATFKMDSML